MIFHLKVQINNSNMLVCLYYVINHLFYLSQDWLKIENLFGAVEMLKYDSLRIIKILKYITYYFTIVSPVSVNIRPQHY